MIEMNIVEMRMFVVKIKYFLAILGSMLSPTDGRNEAGDYRQAIDIGTS
jgi:hypothetical protein